MNNRFLVGTAIGIVIAFNLTILLGISSLSKQITNTNNEVNSIKQSVAEIEKVLFYTNERVKISARERDCLARNVFYEAGIEGHEGKIAVAQVTVNRLKSGRWGNDVCSVVYSPAQFSWTLNKKLKYKQPKGELWEASKLAVNDYLRGIRVNKLKDSHFYHADYIQKPIWADNRQRITKIGKHIFYKTDKKA